MIDQDVWRGWERNIPEKRRINQNPHSGDRNLKMINDVYIEKTKLLRTKRNEQKVKWSKHNLTKLIHIASHRERWHNHLNPDINKAPWSEEEDRTILSTHSAMGNRWAELAKFLPGYSLVQSSCWPTLWHHHWLTDWLAGWLTSITTPYLPSPPSIFYCLHLSLSFTLSPSLCISLFLSVSLSLSLCMCVLLTCRSHW